MLRGNEEADRQDKDDDGQWGLNEVRRREQPRGILMGLGEVQV